MAIKLFGSSITSVHKSVVRTVSKTASKVSRGSSSKSSSTNSKGSSSGNKTSGSSKGSSSGNKASGSTSNKASSSGKKTSTTATSKTVSSNVSKVSSVSKQSTTTKYVTNAAAIYNSSGKKVSTPSSVSTGRPAQSYATQKKVSTTNKPKPTGSATTAKVKTVKAKTITNTSVKSTSNKTIISVSTGRPEQSYSTQKKTSITYNQKISGNSIKKATLPVPAAQKTPLIKKDPSEVSYSNNRTEKSYTHVVAYKPSPSREGAGQMFYMSKTDPKGAKAGTSFATSCIPYVGDAKDIQEAVTGKDLITGKKLTGSDRVLTITAAALPFVSGPMLKSAKEGGKIAVEEAPGMIKKAGTVIKKNAPKVKKAVNKTDVADDTAKVMKKKAVKKVKDTKTKEIVKTEKITQQAKENTGLKQRPSWRQSEIDIAKDYPDFTGQKSFINGEQCTYGKKGSVRPDYYKEGVSIEIKNYKIDTASGRSNLARNIEKQYLKRVDGLPEGTKQTVIIDIRGQSIDEEKMDLLYDNIMHRTNKKVDILFKK